MDALGRNSHRISMRERGRPRSRDCRNTVGGLAAPGKEELESAVGGLQVVMCIIQTVVLSTICVVAYIRHSV